MNQIQEKDWAEESWHAHTGIDSSCDYCRVEGEIGDMQKDSLGANTDKEGKGGALQGTHR
jgi:hypothetical protein